MESGLGTGAGQSRWVGQSKKIKEIKDNQTIKISPDV